ncbi:LacI family transcriptional regulator [Hasllibacter halocynthiae]|uniref:LacI family transcriptional regulator n=1 Tax=Hasllibacter halocynthiae TaxID=595589 RepID=A0A2T0X6Z8_9RHOB|nr:LacI family DNA-binding transcriptional regulator [Hasllibacter halocynthiae]PRY94665.1 LacI family transcriptional regulator [Hasllibacter halocynthiae]
MSGRVTSAEVAARAGVSRSAVSRVFSGASASKATERKVRKAAADLGYRPNVLARSLITGRSRIIGLVVSYLDNQFYPDALERLSEALQAEGYHILVFTAPEAEEPDALVEQMLDYQVDGIIAASVTIGGDLAARCQAAGIPVVLFNRGQDASGLSQVTSANRTGGAEVARFLRAGGHGRIAQITGWLGASTGRDRAEGFRAAAGPLVAEADGMFDRDRAAELAAAMWRDARPDAIFVGNDHMAFGAIDALRSEGAAVGREVSVVGYDDVAAAAWGAYDLTTLRQPARRMAEATVETLLALVEDPDRGAARIEIEGPLVVRGSARVPEGWA